MRQAFWLSSADSPGNLSKAKVKEKNLKHLIILKHLRPPPRERQCGAGRRFLSPSSTAIHVQAWGHTLWPDLMTEKL